MCIANDLSNIATCTINDPSSSSLVALPNESASIAENDYHGRNESDCRTEDMEEQVSLRGCRNLGNSCYLNSAIQMLASVFGFAETLDKHIQDQIENDNDDHVKTKNCTSSLEGTLNYTLKEMLQSNNMNSVDMTDLKSEVDKLSPFFLGYQQQDAHEFLMSLLQLLQDRLFPDQGYPVSSSSATDSPLLLQHFKRSKLSHDASSNETDENDMDVSPMHKVHSYSQLNLEAINHLLHDSVNQNHTMHRSFSTSNLNKSSKSTLFDSPVKTTKKLVGGRAASIESQRLPIVHQPLSTTDETNDNLSSDMIENVGASPENQNHPLESTLSLSRAHDENDTNGTGTLDKLNPTNQILENSESKVQAKQIVSEESCKSSFMNDYFSFDIQTKITCNSCKYTRTRTESNIRHITLSLHSHTDSVQDALRHYFAPQACQLKCDRCFTDGATQSMHIAKLPKTMLLHISRFTCSTTTNNFNNNATFSYTKNSSSIQYPHTLSYYSKSYSKDSCLSPSNIINEFTTPDVQLPSSSLKQYNYQLCSVVNHIGSSAEYGHYTADALRTTRSKSSNVIDDRKWFRFNDEIVTPLSSHDALENQTTAYLLMYSLKDI